MKSEDTRSTYKRELHLYILTTNYLKKKRTIPYTIVSRTTKYLGTNLTKEIKTYTLTTVRH